MKTLAQRCAPIEMLVLDVDGVLTDGRISLAGADVEMKEFHVRDGSGMAVWRNAGKRTAIITGRNSPAVARRAAELRIEFVTQGSGDKGAALKDILSATGLRPDQLAAVGDDLPDVPVLRVAGLAIAVADACPEARQLAHYVTQNRGGRGGVRESIELIMRCQGIWPC